MTKWLKNVIIEAIRENGGNMDIVEQKAIIEAILFAAGKEVEITTLMSALELSRKEIDKELEKEKNKKEKMS